MVVNASAQGNAAVNLAGTNRRYGQDYKLIEDDAPLVDDAASRAQKTLTDGLIAADGFADPSMKSTANALLEDYQTKVAALQMYSHIAIAFERSTNSKNRAAHLALVERALAGLQRPSVTTDSSTYGTASIQGNTITGMASTTSTSTYNDPGAQSRANAASADRNSANAAVSVAQLYPIVVENLPLVQNFPNVLRLEEARVRRMCPGADFGDPAFGT
jgi:hypothetical protein